MNAMKKLLFRSQLTLRPLTWAFFFSSAGLFSSMFLGGCSHQGSYWSKNSAKSPYQAALHQAFDELASADQEKSQNQSQRGLASTNLPSQATKALEDVDFNFSELSRNFEMMVFPKLTYREAKEDLVNVDLGEIEQKMVESLGEEEGRKSFHQLEKDMIQFGTPVHYKFSDKRLVSCYKLLKENIKQWPLTNYFGESSQYKKNQGLKCGVFEVTQISPKVERKDIKQDDLLSVRFFVDQYLRPYGKELDIASTQKAKRSDDYSVRTIRYQLNPQETLSSELSFFPIDLPNFQNPQVQKSWSLGTKNPLMIPNNSYVKNKIKKTSKISHCQEAYQTKYKNILGSEIRIGWCPGHSWPTVIDTDRFFAILVK